MFDRNQGEIARVREERRQIALQMKALQETISTEVEDGYEQLTAARVLLETIEKEMVTEATDVREITEFSYKRGEASLLELIDAQRAFNETMESYNEARAEYARALYFIDSVTGKAVKP